MDINTLRKVMLDILENEDDPEVIRGIILEAILLKYPVEKLNDLHYLMLQASIFPKAKRRGRKKDPRTENITRLMNYACTVKSVITGKSFSSTWEEYAENRTRPRILEKDIRICAGILMFNLKHTPLPDIEQVLTKFKLIEEDLSQYLQ